MRSLKFIGASIDAGYQEGKVGQPLMFISLAIQAEALYTLASVWSCVCAVLAAVAVWCALFVVPACSLLSAFLFLTSYM